MHVGLSHQSSFIIYYDHKFYLQPNIAEICETGSENTSKSMTQKSSKRSKNTACETSEKPKSNKRSKKCELYMEYVASGELSMSLLQGDSKAKANVLQISSEGFSKEETTSKGN